VAAALTGAWTNAAAALERGGVAVVPTDTIYGLVGSALKPAAVEHIYSLRQRDANKPLITLIGDLSDLERFGLPVRPAAAAILEKIWPGPVSVILACHDPALAYLHRGSGGVSFRLPAKLELRELLRQAGPLVAPSANPQGATPAVTIEEARAYFGEVVDVYVDGGRLEAAPSALVDLRADTPRVLRPAPGFRIT
jgi:L-threonylcarbamoyladenylate synthase